MREKKKKKKKRDNRHYRGHNVSIGEPQEADQDVNATTIKMQITGLGGFGK